MKFYHFDRWLWRRDAPRVAEVNVIKETRTMYYFDRVAGYQSRSRARKCDINHYGIFDTPTAAIEFEVNRLEDSIRAYENKVSDTEVEHIEAVEALAKLKHSQ